MKPPHRGRGSPHEFDDERDDLAALDFSVPGDTTDSDLAALAAFDTADDDEEPLPVFSVSNPPGSVTVTTFLDGRVKQIDLSPGVTDMTEEDLAEEIRVIAGLATQEAKSAQYAYSTPRATPCRRPTTRRWIATPPPRDRRRPCPPADRAEAK